MINNPAYEILFYHILSLKKLNITQMSESQVVDISFCKSKSSNILCKTKGMPLKCHSG